MQTIRSSLFGLFRRVVAAGINSTLLATPTLASHLYLQPFVVQSSSRLLQPPLLQHQSHRSLSTNLLRSFIGGGNHWGCSHLHQPRSSPQSGPTSESTFPDPRRIFECDATDGRSTCLRQEDGDSSCAEF